MAMPSGPVPQCGIHKIPMVWKEGFSQKTSKPYAFFTCNAKMEDGNWCSYRPPKPQDEKLDQVHSMCTEILSILKK